MLFEHVVGLGLDFPAYLPKTEPRLFVKLSVLVSPTTSQMVLAFTRLQVLKFKQMRYLDVNFAKACVL